MNVHPPITSLFTPEEVELTMDEELRLLDDRPREARWFLAPEGATEPEMVAPEGVFESAWGADWVRLNEPDDEMMGTLVIDRSDRSVGKLALWLPTPVAAEEFGRALSRGRRVALGLESGARDRRAIFRRALPMAPLRHAVSNGALRFAIENPVHADVPSYEVWVAGSRGVRSSAR